MPLPHFIRRFSAFTFDAIISLKSVSFLLFSLTFLNLIFEFWAPVSVEHILRKEVMFYPSDVFAHLKLAQYALSSNLLIAQKEYALAQELFSQPNYPQENILGIQAPPKDEWLQIENKKRLLEQEVFFWESIFNKHPDYIFAAYKLAVLHVQLGNTQIAEKYVQEAFVLSPADPLGQMIIQQL